MLTGAARDVEAYDGKVTAANTRAGESASASAKVQETASAKVTAANARTAESSSAASAKVVSANVRASESSRAFADVTESSVARAGLAWGSLATKALPLVAVATALITGKMAGDYQQLITKLETTAGESQRNLGMVSKGMLDMAGQVGVSADELAKGMYTVDSAGIHGADSLKVLKAAAQGARQEQADLGHVVDAVTTSLHDYHLPASDAAKVTSELIAAVSHGKTTFDELTGSMHSIEPVAAGAGMTIGQTAGALAAMTASGMHADQAAQNLAHTIGSFENATKPMRDELFQIGLDATDLQTHLGERGIAGTLQMVSDAIVHKMGPAGQIALTALQTNKTAVQGLSTMIGAMPPQLADLATGLLAGTTGQKEFRTAALDLGGTAGALADQFLAAYKSNDGFSASLKSGGPQVQTYIGALAKAVGTADGLRTALMLTGENAGTTNDAIAAVGRASADTRGDIAGWSEVQGNFNQKLAQAGAEAKSLAIEVGQHVLPVLTNVVGWIGSTGLPGLEHLGSGIGSVVHGFLQLPAPIKDATLALAAMGIAEKIGLLDKLGSGAGRVGGAFKSMSSQMSTAFVAAKANQTRLVEESAALWGTSTAQAEKAAVTNGALWGSTATQVAKAGSAMDRAKGNVAGFGAAAGAAAKGGLSALRSGASNLMNMFGGPWVVATAGAVLGIMAIKSAIDQHDAAVKQATRDVQGWEKALAIGPAGGQSASSAASHLADLSKQIDDTKTKIGQLSGATDGGAQAIGIYGFHVGTFSAQIEGNRSKLNDLIKELNSGSDAWQKQLASMTPVEVATAKVAAAQKDLHDTQAKFPANSSEVEGAARRLADAQSALAYDTSLANDASKTQLQRLQDLANKQLASVNSGLAAQQAQLQFGDAVAQLNAHVADGSLTGNALAEAQNSLAQSAISAAQAAGQQAADQDKANGVTNTANDVNAAMLKSLQDNEQYLTGPAKDAIDQQIQILQNATVKTGSLTDAISKMGLTTVTESDSFRQEWGDNVQVLHGATQAQIKDLEGLGYTVKNLPNGDVIVSADTSAARNALTQLTNDYTQYSINVGVKLGAGHFAAADGGVLPGYTPGRDVHQFTSPSGGSLALSGGEAIMRPEFTAAVGSGWVNSMNAAARSGGTGGVRSALGFADGGIFDMFLKANVGIRPDSYAAAEASIRTMVDAAAAAFAPAAPGAPSSVLGNAAIVQSMAAARGWTGAEWNALYALVMRESGFRNTAQNPTSTAYGMFQFLDSTWGGYGLGKTSDPRAQTRAGLDYIGGRYHDPLGAWGHETRYGWYDRGGPLQPGYTLAYNGTGKTEWVNTAEQQSASPAAMPGYGTPFSGAMFGPTGPMHVTAQVRVFVGDREITDIARVEATAVVDRELGALHDDIHYATGH